MVLEGILPENWIERKNRFAFMLGVAFSMIGIMFAILLFPESPSLIAIAFTSILLLPLLRKMLEKEERIEDHEKMFRLKNLYNDNKHLIKVYLLVFLGILLVYSIFAMVLPDQAVNSLFDRQLAIMGGSTGGATFTGPLFYTLLANNLQVLVFCFLLSVLLGDAAIVLIVWNASVWGTIFGNLARYAAVAKGAVYPYETYFIIMLIVFPHMILEVLSYILASISGGVISKDFLKEKLGSTRFTTVLMYNFVLLFIALGVLVTAAGIETLVLDNVVVYKEIIALAFS